MISKKTKYALKAVIMLTAKYASKEPVLIADIAREESIPQKFLESILLELKNKGLLQSKKGKGGGYLLARDPSQINFDEVILIFENPFASLPCVTQIPKRQCEECRHGNVCGIQMVMGDIYSATSQIFKTVTFQDIYQRIQNAREETMYFI